MDLITFYERKLSASFLWYEPVARGSLCTYTYKEPDAHFDSLRSLRGANKPPAPPTLKKKNQYIGLLSHSSARLPIAWRNKQDEGGSARTPLSDFITLISHRVELLALIRLVALRRGRPGKGTRAPPSGWCLAHGVGHARVNICRCCKTVYQCNRIAWNWIGSKNKCALWFRLLITTNICMWSRSIGEEARMMLCHLSRVQPELGCAPESFWWWFYLFIPLFIHFLYPRPPAVVRVKGDCWSQSQLSSGQGGIASWTSWKFIAGPLWKKNNHYHPQSRLKPVLSFQTNSCACFSAARGSQRTRRKANDLFVLTKSSSSTK